MGSISVTISTQAGQKFRRLGASMPELTAEAGKGLATDAVLLFQSYAPKASTRVARSIHSVEESPGVFEVIGDPRNPTSGFAYMGVTRFGHRKLEITPAARGRASVLTTRRARGHGRRAALRFVIDGVVFFRAKIRASQPASDWVESAFPEVRAEAKIVVTNLGRRMMERFQ